MTPDLEAAARALVTACPRPAAALMPLVDLVLQARGDCDASVSAWLARHTGLPLAVVRGVVSSRHGAHADGVRVCTGLSCRWMGSEQVREQLRAVGLPVREVDCLGACAAAPVVARGTRLHDGLTPERLAALVAGERS